MGDLVCIQVQAIYPLTRYRLQRLISTREEDVVGMHRMGSISALEKYAEGTSSQLLYLQVTCKRSCACKRDATAGPLSTTQRYQNHCKRMSLIPINHCVTQQTVQALLD